MALHPLGQLIEEAAGRHRLSMREIARRAGMSYSAIYHLLRTPIEEMPRPSTIRGLAEALDIPEERVVDACLLSVGLPTPMPFSDGSTLDEMRRIITTSKVLTRAERDMFELLIKSAEERLERERADHEAVKAKKR